MSTNINTRRLLTCAAIVGAITTAGAGMASAVPGDHSGGGSGRGGSYSSGDSTGAHHIDPMGYHHAENNPLREIEQEDARTEYHQRQNQIQTPNNARTYQVQGSENGGWKVCKPQARYCK
ncbi:hypothetical protein [Nocardia sp. NBC_01009]|uniref:hypothetical protein n=1 Tax=Nocardia sp. NBC_01009 TaxID=2975996 RepID=UPI00386407AD|nr:hypothetical protein OHA42_32500 [Nocardia sp. NBC_01009]